MALWQAQVAADVEVGLFVAEMGDPALGNLRGVPARSCETKEGLSELCANLIFQAAGIHSAVNFSQIDVPTNVAFSPGSVRIPPPPTKGTMTEARLIEMMPLRKWALIQIIMLMLLSQPSDYKLGADGVATEWCRNKRAWGAVMYFQRALRGVGKEIDERNAERKHPYPYLHPANCPPSTAI